MERAKGQDERRDDRGRWEAQKIRATPHAVVSPRCSGISTGAKISIKQCPLLIGVPLPSTPYFIPGTDYSLLLSHLKRSSRLQDPTPSHFAHALFMFSTHSSHNRKEIVNSKNYFSPEPREARSDI